MKDIIFAGNSLKALKALPTEAKREAGYQLDKIQHGEDPSDWKPMQSIGSGLRELRKKKRWHLPSDLYRKIRRNRLLVTCLSKENTENLKSRY